MRRLLAGTTAFAALTGVVLVLPVYSGPTPEAAPVETSIEEVALGSVEEPAAAAEVQQGTTEPVDGVADTAPTLTVTRTGVAGFSLVGVTWRHDPAVTDVRVQVRVQDAAGRWGAWTEVDAEDAAPDDVAGVEPPERAGTEPLWTGPSTGVQVEVVAAAGATPTGVQLDLVDPGTSPADSSLGTPDIQDTADAALAMPDVYSRAQWGADESIRTWGPQYASTIKAATLHHTAGSNNYSADQVPQMVRSIYAYHAQSLGWGDIGYNVLVDKYGRLWEGRYGGLASTVIGAHAGGFNTGTFGVSMMGNYDVVDTTQPMVDAVAAITAWKFSLYGVDPNGTTRLTSGGTDKWARGTAVELPTIFGHRDTKSTACPGRYGYARLPEIRAKVSAAIGSALPLVQQRYSSDAEARALLGAETTSPTRTPDGAGAYGHYRNGSLYASVRTPAVVIRGEVYTKWASLGWENSPLGYPTSDTTCGLVDGGCFSHFEQGSIYWSAATGARVVSGAVRDRWAAAGWENGPLGYPLADQGTTPDRAGQYVHFQRGSIYWSQATGARVLSGDVRARWAASGWENGPLGYPTTDVVSLSRGGGQFAHFQQGSIYWSPTTGARILLASIRDRWGRTGWEGGSLGYPVADQTATPGGRGQVVAFERGWVYWSEATGARVLTAAVRDAWSAAGGDGGDLGMPVGDAGTTPDGLAQFGHFAGGSVYVHAEHGVRVLPRSVVAAWAAAGWEHGPLGYPTSDSEPVAGGDGTVVRFEGGKVFASETVGAHGLWPAVLDRYEASGGPGGDLGMPVGDVRTHVGGTSAEFEGGSVYWSASTGARVLTGEVLDHYEAADGPDGALGYPTTDVMPLTGGGEYADFQHGSVYWSPSTGALVVTGAVRDRYRLAGGPAGVLGRPLTDVTALSRGGGAFAHFEGGSVYWSPATGARIVSGAVRDRWAASGWETGTLGYPTTDVTTIARGGQYAHFQRGSVYWSPATGARIVSGAVRDRWAASGWETGTLGYPTTDTTSLSGGAFAHFESGSVYWSSSTGARVLSGAIRDAWAGTGWERGRLGYPTGEAQPIPGGTRQQFQGGSVTAANGRTTVQYR